ncbi:MAG TPA: protein phosphatase 2C domain-containing protein [Pyrinomonadaceae bacterium]|nr:protein phosphatase 2C domain-containing protein [Pyrinomonadaceae bacterium]
MMYDTAFFDGQNARLDDELPESFSPQVDVDVFGTSHRGHVRSNNEDHFLVIRGGRALETVHTNLPQIRPGDLFEETAYALIVADGVGGEVAGEVASRHAIFTLLNLALRTPDWQVRWGSKEKNTVMWRMQDRFRRVNASLLQEATAHSVLRGMCTTMTAAVTHGDNLIVTHIGDSRAYLWRRGHLKRLTRDHTVAERLNEDLTSAEEDRLLLELRSVLLQALGSHRNECRIDVGDFVLEDRDCLLLCTDGLTDMVGETEIQSVLAKEIAAKSACQTLVDLALANGGRDNVTAIVARYSIPRR